MMGLHEELMKYRAKRYEQMMDPYVCKKRPYWMYDAVQDSRTRPVHAALNGIIRRWDDPFWDTFYPPNGYECRCSVRTLTEEQARQRGYKGEKGILEEIVDNRTGEVVKNPKPDPGYEKNFFKD